MHVTEISVSAGTTFNNPVEKFSNFRPGVTLKAVLKDGENVFESARQLQDMADSAVLLHRERILKRIDDEQPIEDRQTTRMIEGGLFEPKSANGGLFDGE